MKTTLFKNNSYDSATALIEKIFLNHNDIKVIFLFKTETNGFTVMVQHEGTKP